MDIYCDGGARGNQNKENIGAWAYVVYNSNGDEIYHLADAVENTTNNRMELGACIWAVSLEGEKYDKLIIYSDSKYVVNGINAYSYNWKRNGYKKANGGTVKNVELWKKLINLVSIHDVTFKHVKGHSGDIGNERADELLNVEMDKYVRRDVNYESDMEDKKEFYSCIADDY